MNWIKIRRRAVVWGLAPLLFLGIVLGFIFWPLWAGFQYARDVIKDSVENLE